MPPTRIALPGGAGIQNSEFKIPNVRLRLSQADG